MASEVQSIQTIHFESEIERHLSADFTKIQQLPKSSWSHANKRLSDQLELARFSERSS